LALAALGWVLEGEERAARYLDLTGLDPDTLRAGLGDPMILASALEFLINHEPDLIRAAEALAVTPSVLVAAKDALEHLPTNLDHPDGADFGSAQGVRREPC